MRTLLVSAVAVAFAAAGPGFEPAATFQASKILPATIARGSHDTVSEEVKAEGFYQAFHIASDFGDMDAEGRTLLRTRVSEIDALARLDEASKTEIFAKAAGGAVLNVGKGLVSAVRDPGARVGGADQRHGYASSKGRPWATGWVVKERVVAGLIVAPAD